MSPTEHSSTGSDASHASHQHSPPITSHPFETFETDTSAESDGLERHLTLFDLTSIGVGGTVGSGIFVLTGQIAHEYAGPATFLSWTLAGLAALMSGLAFAELAARIPHSGSTYAYARIVGGKHAAVVAAACLTLEYVISGSAVARTWGDKVLIWWARMAGEEHTPWLMGILQPVEWINFPASLLCIACTSLLLAGVRESKLVTNVVTAVKMLLVGFMIVGGFFLFQPANMGPPLAPFGTEGVLRGATSSFFGYLGYDEICVVAGEALHPKRDLPRAVLGTLAIVTVCYILAAVALTGMLPYTEISSTSGFPEAFADRDWAWAAQLTAVGEISTLPVVVLISLLAQPRLTFAMAKDGLLPAHIFAPVNEAGETSLWYGTMLSGVVMTLIAAVVPFTYLDDLISCGILVAFSMTNSALIQLRCMPAGMAPASLVATLPRTLTVYHALCFLTALAWNKDGRDSSWTALAVLSTIALVSCLLFIMRAYPAIPGFFGGLPTEDSDCHPGETYFTTPAVPFVPCLGIAVNWYLIAQLEVTGLVLLALYLASSLVLYRVWGRPNAHVGGHAYESVCDRPPTGEIAANLVRRRSPAEELRSVS